MPKKKEYRWKDFDLDFMPHPDTGDLRMRFDEQAVESSFKNLVKTQFGQKLFKPRFGSGIFGQLFNNLTLSTRINIENSIKNVIELHEPRAKLLNVDVVTELDGNTVRITITYQLINTERTNEMRFFINRIR
jgi:phage baseplate assembly protein W